LNATATLGRENGLRSPRDVRLKSAINARPDNSFRAKRNPTRSSGNGSRSTTNAAGIRITDKRATSGRNP
jgi:hypothetical protein